MAEKAKEIRLQHSMSEESEDRDSQDLLDGGAGDDVSDSNSIDLDNLTSDDEESDEEEKEANEATQNKRKFRVNEKGETPLHLAAKKGDIKSLRRLIRQGHTINPRDSAGWIPLHEACNFGNLEVVEELLKHGAHLNDQPAGRDCDKITPIHDAANNGHLDVMKVLIDYGASVLLKDAHGNYPIDSLIVCRELAKASGEPVAEEELLKYQEMKSLLKTLMAKAGKPYLKDHEKRARKKARKVGVDEGPSFQLMESSRSRHEVPIPVKVAVDDFDPDDATAAVDFYSSAILGLRGKNKPARKSRDYSDNEEEDRVNRSASRSPAEPRTALIAESQYVDEDWLEDDLGVAGKKNKRKRDPLDDVRLLDRNMRRKREGQRNDVALLDLVGDLLDDSEEEEDSAEFQSNKSKKKSSHSPRKSFESLNPPPLGSSSKGQLGRTPSFLLQENSGSNEGLADLGSGGDNGNSRSEFLIEDDDRSNSSNHAVIFEKSRKRLAIVDSDSDEIQEVSRLSCRPSSLTDSSTKKKGKVIQTRLPFKSVSSSSLGESSFRNRAPPHNDRSQVSKQSEITNQSVLRLKIRIGDKTFIVPVVESQMDETIDWLCEECSRRYFDANGVKPVLTLSTNDGAILSRTDIIRIVLSGSETELLATLVTYDLPRLTERFKSAVLKAPDLKFDDNVLRALDVCQSSNVLILSDNYLRDQLGQVIFQALQCQFLLRELNLSSCSLYDEGVKKLAAIIPTLPGLVILDLSSNGITTTGLSTLSEAFKKRPQNMPQDRPHLGLISLNLSFNPIGSSAGPVLTDLLSQMSQLRQLYIADCDLSVRVFAESRLANAVTKLKLEDLDISYNDWGRNGLEILLQSLSVGRLRILNCTSCGTGDDSSLSESITSFLSRNEDCCNLKSLNLTDCSLTDERVQEITSQFSRLVCLESLTMANNEDLTMLSMERILFECTRNKIPLGRLDLGSCPSLWRRSGIVTERILNALDDKLSSEKKLDYLRLTKEDQDEDQRLITDENKPALSTDESRIRRLWEEYSGTATYNCTQEGSSIVFTYDQ